MYETVYVRGILKATIFIGDVLDPFCGSGTTGVVALRYHRDFVGIELNPVYARLAEKRIGAEAPLLNNVEVKG